ncbi:aminotransferase class I/II-fold pyridoxal phosphate-dependent enzyme [Effusibacillus consociatus]|uniref:Aminotransferase class I/II-fold pyridoxal phosphate-dependent enzyme n=1 Tax=Effusibacillus consociatus TaxID=1117041 RepID=A0ABV9PWJ9_9BACL
MNDSEFASLAVEIKHQIEPVIKRIEENVLRNQAKVLAAFQEAKVSDYHFSSSTGYGYNDRGREIIEQVYATTFRAEAALVRPHIVSGTHAICLGLFGVLRPEDELLYITGAPYDTLEEVIGVRGNAGDGSLRDFGVTFHSVPLRNNKIDWDEIRRRIHSKTKMVGIQRSSGYAWRPSFTVAEIRQMVRFVKEIKPDVIVMVDNCYGEFTETEEPTEAGADLVVGSLIKNPGGGLAPTGGYLVGRSEIIHRAACRLTAPGIGAEQGAMLGTNRGILQGFFLAPHVVGEALKGAVYASAMFERVGLETSPRWEESRTDIIQAVRLGSKERLIAFCQAIQSAAPVDSHVKPEPWDMPGYEDPVIMAAGAFVQGASIELSADGPIRDPYIGFMQGGITYEHVQLAILSALETMKERKLL